MDSLHSTMNQHVKGKHLSFEERVIIQLRLKDGYSLRAIARELNCSPSTISYEVKRGTVKLYHGKVKKYKATQGHDAYKAHRKNCGRKSDFLKKTQFTFTMSTNISSKTAGRLMFAVIVPLLLANSLAAMLSAPKLFIITLIKAY